MDILIVGISSRPFVLVGEIRMRMKLAQKIDPFDAYAQMDLDEIAVDFTAGENNGENRLIPSRTGRAQVDKSNGQIVSVDGDGFTNDLRAERVRIVVLVVADEATIETRVPKLRWESFGHVPLAGDCLDGLVHEDVANVQECIPRDNERLLLGLEWLSNELNEH